MHAFSPEIDGNAIKALQHIHAQQQRRFVVQMELMKRAHVGKDNRQIGDAEAADLDLIDKVPAAHDSVARDAYDLYGAQRLDLPLVCQCAEQSEVADTPVRSGIQYDVDLLPIGLRIHQYELT